MDKGPDRRARRAAPCCDLRCDWAAAGVTKTDGRLVCCKPTCACRLIAAFLLCTHAAPPSGFSSLLRASFGCESTVARPCHRPSPNASMQASDRLVGLENRASFAPGTCQLEERLICCVRRIATTSSGVCYLVYPANGSSRRQLSSRKAGATHSKR